jgi:hypothetical protein
MFNPASEALETKSVATTGRSRVVTPLVTLLPGLPGLTTISTLLLSIRVKTG